MVKRWLPPAAEHGGSRRTLARLRASRHIWGGDEEEIKVKRYRAGYDTLPGWVQLQARGLARCSSAFWKPQGCDAMACGLWKG